MFSVRGTVSDNSFRAELKKTENANPVFKDAAFKLEKPGDFTKPVHTQFGYHIIRLLKKDSEDLNGFSLIRNTNEVNRFICVEIKEYSIIS